MNQPRPYEHEADIFDYIKVIYKYRLMVMILVLGGMFFTGILNLTKPETYETSAAFFPINVKEYYNPASEILGMQRQLNIGDLIVAILESRKMADKIIEELKLKDLWGIGSMVEARKILGSKTKITLGRNGVIKLSVRARSPEIAAQIANAYVDNLDYFNRQLSIGSRKEIVQVIDRATVPEQRMPRGTIRRTLTAGVICLTLATMLAFFFEFIKKNDIMRKLKEA